MPVDRADSKPRTKASNVATARAIGTAVHGAQPNRMPRPLSATMFPTAKPATPKMSHCASDVMPPYPERKTMVDAARPSMSARVMTKSTKKSDPNAGSSTMNRQATATATLRADTDRRGEGVVGASPTPVTALTHSRRPNRPFGRTASTTARITKVKMIE